MDDTTDATTTVTTTTSTSRHDPRSLPAHLQAAASLVSHSYLLQGSEALQRRRKLIKSLLSERRLPKVGWDDAQIEMFLDELALMDSNNFVDNVGLGEREGRVAYHLVAKRHYGMSHGIGRSGELSAEQPKAAGSSLLAKVANYLVRDAVGVAGVQEVGKALVIPVATGMALVLSMLALRSSRPDATVVVWSRIDQKTCVKSITAAGYTVVCVELKREGTSLVTDVDAIEDVIVSLGVENVACVLTTTSCFAPRSPDDVVGVGKVCKRLEVPHIINNAYGIQSRDTCRLITSAWRKGRVDVVVQSTDKNFMVPVGGSFLLARTGCEGLVLDKVNSLYPGRASMGPTMDVVMTLLHLGEAGWREALARRDVAKARLEDKLRQTCSALGESPIVVPGNDISFGMTLDTFVSKAKGPSFLGAMLFKRGASGARVLLNAQDKETTVGGVTFRNFGQSYDGYPHAYLTVAAALGVTEAEIDEFFARMVACASEFQSKTSQL